ncbi:hypothetical protein DMN91_009740 [Ooceraea biroi]|uniref:Hemolymph lipopolysaccharide-binding protein n=1 Tax=Ooceraea biroi TaxID=2015173 RepID=A0A026WKD2_OOCBI|nr:hemolymph lipopolysaccharide-binding protein [Ooceraea biroi]XP_019886833.1 hemolymph lipopolysaccharide-binding protein [Ooceraea biroi]XP_019886834.1 hemolymph lipopolysaccharide-binding protein [Ooceraea biroi]XP_019886835.1 hemolymph lipopolysaccharide-binding protein [Ooceraea biroi]XP_019886836.1 hemolymph lipopolysaccharide-binding protein [Ooceraea biroi]EZA56438.1 Hemolymph lipopolysaccharide-binding protein [Ooceraea biroi]RLU17505.1 hypothetical protein DMN91_009740 [Ooceraea bi
MMYFLLISCVALHFGAREQFVSAAPSLTDEYGSTEHSNTPIGTNTETGLRIGNTHQHGCPCSDGSSGKSDELTQQRQHLEQLYSRNMMVHGMMCMCNVAMRGAPMRDDYHYTVGIGSHKLHTRVATWNEARKACNEEGGHLAIINSMAEERVLVEMFNRSGSFKGAATQEEAFLGLHDLYKEGEWVTVLGDSLAKTGYSKWSERWGGQPDNGGGKQHCGSLVKDGSMDDVACEIMLPFFCELPMIQPLH